jgi:putative acetyltransferase
MRSLRPWVVETADGLVAYGDLQPNGYIDHFYVAGSQGRKGFGSALMAHLLAEAKVNGIDRLHARVSLTAQPLFLNHGFIITTVNTFILRGVEISNATMVREGPARAPGGGGVAGTGG